MRYQINGNGSIKIKMTEKEYRERNDFEHLVNDCQCCNNFKRIIFQFVEVYLQMMHNQNVSFYNSTYQMNVFVAVLFRQMLSQLSRA